MERFRYDRSSKWMIQHQGRLLLFLGQIDDVEECRTSQAEVVQPRQIPDGLLEVRRRGQKKYHPVIVEIDTYPEKKTIEDLIDDVMLVYQDRRELPDVLVLILHPKGKAEVADALELRSEFGLTGLRASWRVVELWRLKASDLLATGEPGLMPWVSLTQIDGPIESVFQDCRRIIDEKAKPTEHDNLLAISQVLLGLNYQKGHAAFGFFGGKEAMIDSPYLNEILEEQVAKLLPKRVEAEVRRVETEVRDRVETEVRDRVETEVRDRVRNEVRNEVAQTYHKVILRFLHSSFGQIPGEISSAIYAITDPNRLDELCETAARASDLESFGRELGRAN